MNVGLRNAMLMIAVCFIFLIIQLGNIQLVSDKYKKKAFQTTLHKKTLIPSRGEIYDRNGKLLVSNDPLYEIEFVYNELSPEMDTTLLCDLLKITKEDFNNYVSKNWKNVQYEKNLPTTFLSGISYEEFLPFQEQLFQFPGFYTNLHYKRKYEYPNAAHTLGYIGEVNSSVINNNPNKFKKGDHIGISGIEKEYNDLLMGTKGVTYVFKDNLGREIRSESSNLVDKKAQPGTDVKISLDIDLQQYGEKLMQGKMGSIVVIEPATGQILTAISSPSYDPNKLTLGRKRGQFFKELQYDTLRMPLLDRCVLAEYPPGSIFKPILSLIALQEGVTYPRRKIKCTGVYEINKEKGYVQKCREHPTPFNIGLALQYSCNTYYYKLMEETVQKYGYHHPGKGLQMINDYLDDFGLGRVLGSDLTNENSGFIGTPQYFDRLYNYVRSGWKASYILSMGIGQGEIQMTTLQMANLAAILANRGYYYIPHIFLSSKKDNVLENRFEVKHTIPIEQHHYKPVIDGMEKVIKAGTGYSARVRGIDICGKTGTSQNPFGKDHSVFFAFAPKEDPKIAIAVFVENAGGGGELAAPIGSLIIEKYLNKEIRKNRTALETRIKEIDLIPST